jgi:hypothetical protein
LLKVPIPIYLTVVSYLSLIWWAVLRVFMAMGISLGGSAMTGFGTEGSPVISRVSTTNIPTDKTVQMQSDNALFYTFLGPDGKFIGQIATPNGVPGPFVAAGGLISIPYPTTATVYVYDLDTLKLLGSQDIQLFGGDVFKVRVAYKEWEPIANGFVSVLLNGTQNIVRGEEYQGLPYTDEDVIPRGSY